MKVHKKLSDLLFRYLLFLFTIVTVIAVIMIGVYMFQSGGPSIAKVGKTFCLERRGILPWNRQSMEFYHFCYHPYFL